MRITEEMLAMLNGDDGHTISVKFSNLKTEVNMYNRINGVLNILHERGCKNIIHVGCCNHPDFVDYMIDRDEHLQVLLSKEFPKAVGFDINEAAYKKCRARGIEHTYLCGFTNGEVTSRIIKDEK